MISKTPGPEIDDINTMHRYRDAIVYQNGAGPYERTMFGAYILFPYHDEKEYKNHHFYQSISQVNIGGLPFLPSATGLVTEMLDELISDSPDSAFERATLPVGIEEKLAKVNWDERDVLIGTVSNVNQFYINKKYNFYHTPVSNIPKKGLPIRYVALYQTINMFGKENAGIKYYGEVVTTEIVKRSEIREIPKKSSQLYYRFNVREWKELVSPVKAKEIGFPIGFTNMFLLENSTQTPELLLQSEAEYRFYTELKRRVNYEIINKDDPNNGFRVGECSVFFDHGEIVLSKGGNIKEKYPISYFINHPNSVFRNLYREAQKASK